MKIIKILSTIFVLIFLITNYLTADIVPDNSLIASNYQPPKFKNIVKPIYPIEAKRAEKEGTVLLQATIDLNGISRNIKALTQLGFGLEEASIEALQKSTFHPATQEGKVVVTMVKIPYEFKLESDDTGMVLITAGEFQMGSNKGNLDEMPIHTVHLDAYYIDKYEVTNAEYKKFVDANPQWRKEQIPSEYHDGYYLADWFGDEYPSGKENHPVVYVSWYAAMAYAKWVEKRLPTEAEWEKAARGGLVGRTYPWGDTIDSNQANYYDGTDKEITPVGSFTANSYGLYDMVGNVREWCLDGYNENYYKNSRRENPVADAISIDEIVNNFIKLKNNRVLRGGSWLNSAQSSRISNRNWRAPTDTNPNEGFRCVTSVSQ